MVALRKHAVPMAPMSVGAFLAWTDALDGDTGYELVDGFPRAMAPTTNRHGVIQANVLYMINRHLVEQRRPCVALVAPGVQPRVRADSNLRIPDVGVSCSAEDFGGRALAAPVLLVEVLSRSNRRQTWSNVWTYTTIPSVHEVLVLNAEAVAAELLRRQPDGGWPERTQALGPDDTLVLESIGLDVPLAAAYAGTDLVVPPA